MRSWSTKLAPADERPVRRWVNFAIARATMYADCDEADARAAFDRLRPQASTPYFAPFSLTEFPDVPATYVVAAEDRIISPAWSRRTAAERLGVEAIELPGSHSPYLARPAVLAELLADQA